MSAPHPRDTVARPSEAGAPVDLQAKLRYLQNALSGGRGPAAVPCIETHMSWVILGEHHVLKLKKPVKYSFLDFSEVKGRERYVREELRLNRRLAPGVYLGVLALQWTGTQFALAPGDGLRPSGTTVDWLVLMKRLPGERGLDRAMACGSVTPLDLETLVQVLAAFYRRASRAGVSEADYVQRLCADVAESRRVLTLAQFKLQEAGGLVGRMEAALQRHRDMLARRVAEGRIVDGHGDLRPQHVYLPVGQEPPVVIDALEFDARLREVDPVDELSYLALECAMAGNAGIGRQILARCAAAMHDDHPPALAQLHTARRALLRARLSAAHLLDTQVAEPDKWLPLAGRYLEHARAALDALDGSQTTPQTAPSPASAPGTR